MNCGGCAAAVRRAIEGVTGVEAVSVNFDAGTASVVPEPAVDHGELRRHIGEAIRSAGFRDEAPDTGGGDEAAQGVAWGRRAAAGLLLATPLMVIMFIEIPGRGWIELALAAPVQFLVGWPFLVGGWRAARGGRANMDTLVAGGSLVAFGYSLYQLISGHGHGFFETAAFIIAFISIGKWLEARSRRRAGDAVRGLLDLTPERARRLLDDGELVEVEARDVEPGWLLEARPGERFAVDGSVESGAGSVDESMLTGESAPVARSAGEPVIAGTLSLDGRIRYRAERVGGDTVLAGIVELVETARSTPARLQRIADAVAAVFVPAIMTIAALTGGAWLLLGHGVEDAVRAAVAVLVVACPCALGLATPTAVTVGAGLAARRGILVRDARSLEDVSRIDTWVLDKTGTLTTGTFHVVGIAVDAGMSEREALRLAASLEAASAHPIGIGIVNEARARGLTLSEVEHFRTTHGMCVEGTVEGCRLVIGRPGVFADRGMAVSDTLRAALDGAADEGLTAVGLGMDGRLVAVIGLADEVRTDALPVIRGLRGDGARVVMLTGDHRAAADRVATELGIDEVIAEVLPDGKVAQVGALRSRGERVAMVGDGVNDAPGLATADVGVAVGAGTDIAIDAADVIMLADGVAPLGRLIRISRETRRVIHQNLFFALIYNMVLVPLAAVGVLHPALAAAAMSLSSITVVMNSLRLRWRMDSLDPVRAGTSG